MTPHCNNATVGVLRQKMEKAHRRKLRKEQRELHDEILDNREVRLFLLIHSIIFFVGFREC
jgi:hypothetical protein